MSGAKKARIAELADYYAKLGMSYGGDGNSKNWLYGPYRDLALHVYCKRDKNGSNSLGEGYFYDYYQESLQQLYSDFLLVECPVNDIPQLMIFRRSEWAPPYTGGYVRLPDGTKHVDPSERFVGYDILDAHYLKFSAVVDGLGVPEFDAEFVVSCHDKDFAHAVLSPELLTWIARDPRSRQLRMGFFKQQAVLTSRSYPTDEKHTSNTLFAPQWIFPIADYLVELLQRIPSDLIRPVPRPAEK